MQNDILNNRLHLAMEYLKSRGGSLLYCDHVVAAWDYANEILAAEFKFVHCDDAEWKRLQDKAASDLAEIRQRYGVPI